MPRLAQTEFEHEYGMPFGDMFGFSIIPRKLPEEEVRKEHEIYMLFGLMQDELGMQAWQIFTEAGASTSLCSFLHEVRNCPEPVLEFCRRALSADSPQRARYTAIKEKGRPT